MKCRLILILTLLINSINLEGQINFKKGEIKDSRDGRVYQTIEIDNIIWFSENLKYQSKNSVDIENTKEGVNLDGNYYPYEESDNVCPENFRIPKVKEWKQYLNKIIELKNISKTSIKDFEIEATDASGFKDLSDKIQLFKEPNPLNLRKSGFIQGTKLKALGTLNFWIRKGESPDKKYHLHIVSEGYSKHSHKHHINDRKKRKRKFVVRCVKNKLIE